MIPYKLQIQALRYARPTQVLFANLSFELNNGEVLVIEGENGSGKSTLLKVLAGLMTPSNGTIDWQRQPILDSITSYSENVHYLGHTNGIKLGLSVEENLTLAAHLSLSPLTDLDAILSSLKLNKQRHHLAKHLSAGQKRKLALAKLLLFSKPLWILDEPFTALDSDIQSFFLLKLEDHLKNGGMAIISTHHTIPFKNSAVKHLRLEVC